MRRMKNSTSHKPWIDVLALRGPASWLAILGAAFYWSWMDNAMFSDLLFTIFRNDSTTANLANIGFSCTLLASAAILLLALFAKRALFNPKTLFPLKTTGILGALGALSSGAMMIAGAFDLSILGIASAILVGVTMGLIQIIWGRICIAQGHRSALIHISGTWACGFFLNVLIANLVPLTRGLFVVTLPLLTAVAFIALGKLQNHALYCVTSEVESLKQASLKTPLLPKHALFGVDWRLPLFTLVFCVAFGFMYSLEVFPTTVDNPGNAFQFIAFRGFTALALFAISLTPLVSHISTVFVACLSLMAAGVLTLTVQIFTGNAQTLGAILIATGYAGFDALIWTLIAYYGNLSKPNAVKIIALVMCVEQIGIYTGNLLGSSVVNQALDATLFIAFMYLFLLAAFGLTQLSSKVLNISEEAGEAMLSPTDIHETYEAAQVLNETKVVKPESHPLEVSSTPATSRELKPSSNSTSKPVVESTSSSAESLEGSTETANAKTENTEPFAAIVREYGLTNREQEILAPFSEGRSVPYIAKMLFLSENTVKSHLRHIYTKCEVHNKQALLDLIRSYESQ